MSGSHGWEVTDEDLQKEWVHSMGSQITKETYLDSVGDWTLVHDMFRPWSTVSCLYKNPLESTTPELLTCPYLPTGVGVVSLLFPGPSTQ